MITVINPKHSFVAFHKEGVFESLADTVLPIAKVSDLRFQLKVTGTAAEMDNVMLVENKIRVVNNHGAITTFASMIANTLLDYAVNPHLELMKYRINATTVLLYWPHGLPAITTTSGCFRLALDVPNTYFVSNTFKVVKEDRYTAAIEYSCFENNNGFDYCSDDLPNRVRLPLHLADPQYQDDETIYIRSGGEIDILKSVTRKEYEGATDFMPDTLHGRVRTALSSDVVTIESYIYTGGIRKNGNYSIDWEQKVNDEAPASFKVYATPYDVRNSNCANCE